MPCGPPLGAQSPGFFYGRHHGRHRQLELAAHQQLILPLFFSVFFVHIGAAMSTLEPDVVGLSVEEMELLDRGTVDRNFFTGISCRESGNFGVRWTSGRIAVLFTRRRRCGIRRTKGRVVGAVDNGGGGPVAVPCHRSMPSLLARGPNGHGLHPRRRVNYLECPVGPQEIRSSPRIG